MKYRIYKNLKVVNISKTLGIVESFYAPIKSDDEITLIAFTEDIVKSKLLLKALNNIKNVKSESIVCAAKYFTDEAKEIIKKLNYFLISYGVDVLNYSDDDFYKTKVFLGSKVKGPKVNYE